MYLILELLQDVHLDCFGLADELKAEIKQVLFGIREAGKRVADSKSFFFNHMHYNCLFLTLTSKNSMKLSSKMITIHKKVFLGLELADAASVMRVNILKKVFAYIV